MSSDILFGFFILQTISRIFIGFFKSLGRFYGLKTLTSIYQILNYKQEESPSKPLQIRGRM